MEHDLVTNPGEEGLRLLYALYDPQAAAAENEKNAAGCEKEAEESVAEPGSYRSPASYRLPASVQPFRFTIERMRHYHGAWHSVTATLFPNFLFLDCEADMAEKLKEEGLPLVSIPEELSGLLYDLCDKEHHIPMSKGVIRNGLAHVTEGPLTGHDNRIVRIDRHKRMAWLKVSGDTPKSFAKDSTSVLVAGLEITERVS